MTNRTDDGWAGSGGFEAIRAAFAANRKINLQPRSSNLPSWLAVNHAGAPRLWPPSRATWLHPPEQCTVDCWCRCLVHRYCHRHHRRHPHRMGHFRSRFRSMSVNSHRRMRHCNCHFRSRRYRRGLFLCCRRYCHHRYRRSCSTAARRSSCNHPLRTPGRSWMAKRKKEKNI